MSDLHDHHRITTPLVEINAVTGPTTRLGETTRREEPTPEVLAMMRRFEAYQKHRRRIEFAHLVAYPLLCVLVFGVIFVIVFLNMYR